jgi:hypothetical protein
MSKFLNLLNSVLKEQTDEEVTPTELDSTLKSELPNPEDVALDILKYKTLLTSLRKALYIAFKGNMDVQRTLSNINIDTQDLNDLKKIEDRLINLLNQTESVPTSSEE